MGDRFGRFAAWATIFLVLVATEPAAGRFVAFESGQVRPLALSPDGSRLYAVNTPDNRLEVLATDDTLTSLAAISVGLEPVAVAVRNSNEVWVVNHLSDSVSIVDVSASPPRVVRTLLVGDEPRDIVFAGPSRERAFITTAHRGQHRLDIPTNRGGGDPQLTTPGIGRADVWVFDANDPGAALGGSPLTILTLFGDTPRALAVSPDGGIVYAAVFHSGNQSTTVNERGVCNTSDANLAGGTLEGSCFDRGLIVGTGGLPLPHTTQNGDPRPETGIIVKWNGAHWVDRSCPSGVPCGCQAGINRGSSCTQDADCPESACGRIWDETIMFRLPDRDVFAIDANANPPVEISSYSQVGTLLFNMAVNPVSGKVYVSNGDSKNEVRFESAVQGRLSEYRITVLDGTQVLPRHLNKHIPYSSRPVPEGVRERSLATPTDMVVTGDGQTLYVAAFGSSRVGVFATSQIEDDTFVPTRSQQIVVSGGGPSGLQLDERKNRLYVLTRFDNAISIIDTRSHTEVAHHRLFNPEPATVVEGRRFLYDAELTSSNGEASCSSCHPFADMDDLAWDLGNPQGFKIPNPLPIRLKAAALSPGSEIGTHPDFDFFPAMKGPMATQTLRGMANHGAMHWRGDRTNQNGDVFDADASFRNFRVTFPDLLGLEHGVAETDMQAFADFVLQIRMPPNPIRALDNSLEGDQQRGKTFMTGPRRVEGFPTDFTGEVDGFSCAGCHAIDPAKGHFGADGRAAFNDETQIFKTPHLRNLYQKIGMFGFPPRTHFFIDDGNDFMGDQVRGFGFFHDGSVDTIFRTLLQANFRDHGEVGLNGGDTQKHELEEFLLAFDSDFAPILAQQTTLGSADSEAARARVDLLIERASAPFVLKDHDGATECDLIIKGIVDARARGWLRIPSGLFRSDRAAEQPLTDEQLRALAARPGQQLTYTCVPPGSGLRMGLDRDEDGHYDTDEIDGGSDPADALSTPGVIPTPTVTPVPCAGDCNRDDAVRIDELVLLVNMALGERAVSACTPGDTNADAQISIDELVRAVGTALNGC